MNSGTGPGVITPDGCAVELYTLLAPAGEPEIIASVVRPGASILELGCGTGRVTHALCSLGYALTAVDQSQAMLARVHADAVVLADIETLRLARTFDAVILGSFLIHDPRAQMRASFLGTCHEHVAADGIVLIERHPVDFFTTAQVGPIRALDAGVRAEWRAIERNGDLFKATIAYEHERGTWTQTFIHAALDERQLENELHAAGLAVKRRPQPGGNWLLAQRIQA